MQYAAVSRTAERTLRRRIGAFTIVIGAILAAVGITAGPSLAFTGPEPLPSTDESNSPSHWGTDCWKVEPAQGLSWEADDDYGIVVLKAGQTDWVFYDVVEGDVLTVGGQNEISHFIFCPPTVEETTTTVEETTTTVEETTTTVEETTTTVEVTTTTTQGIATTVPETSTTVDQAGPTTTQSGSAGGAIPPELVELPKTGNDGKGVMVALGVLMMAIGGALVGLTRRNPA